jgi:hypothetical protein
VPLEMDQPGVCDLSIGEVQGCEVLQTADGHQPGVGDLCSREKQFKSP